MIALLDYGSGNLCSVQKALEKVGADVRLATSPKGMREARAAVLPGVGAFDDCITAMQRQELLAGVREFIQSGRPFLGICVGYQALFEKSEEFHSCAAGLGIFRGKVVRFTEQPGLKIPQIGWNQIEIVQPSCPLLQGIASGSHVYFVHSFAAPVTDMTLASTEYGAPFSAIVQKDNIYGVQFHPERSARVGAIILRNFLSIH